MPEQTFSALVIAKMCDISIQRVGQLAKDGTITRLANGKYPSDVIPQYIRFIRGISAKSDWGELLEQEKYREKKRINDEAEELLSPVEKLGEALSKVGAQIVPILETLPLSLKRNCPWITGDQIRMVQVEIAKCRNIIKDIHIE